MDVEFAILLTQRNDNINPVIPVYYIYPKYCIRAFFKILHPNPRSFNCENPIPPKTKTIKSWLVYLFFSSFFYHHGTNKLFGKKYFFFLFQVGISTDTRVEKPCYENLNLYLETWKSITTPCILYFYPRVLAYPFRKINTLKWIPPNVSFPTEVTMVYWLIYDVSL